MASDVVTIEKNEHFERLLSTDKDMQKRMQAGVKKVLGKARTQVSRDAKGNMQHDPRAAYKAVKRSVYKKMLGGNISILSKRRAGSTRVSVTKDTTHTGRGGNRLKRSARTEQVDSYYGADRGFILRFINAGTAQRSTRYGNRGSIAARGWFGSSSRTAVNTAADEFCQIADKEIKNTKV